jgi:alanine-glyoxylate transaminase/serine-glyoxylate transaminase/serine-pyruvate transaminase
MPNIYEGELIDISNEVFERLPGIARTTGTVFVTISNGHGAGDGDQQHVVAGDRVLVLESGRFAVAWGEMAAFSGVQVEVLEAPERGPSIRRWKAWLRADTARNITAVFVARRHRHLGARNDIAAIRRAMDAADHPRCSWSTASPRWPARSTTMDAGRSTSPWPARRRA